MAQPQVAVNTEMPHPESRFFKLPLDRPDESRPVLVLKTVIR
jgi:hypothetical protein